MSASDDFFKRQAERQAAIDYLRFQVCAFVEHPPETFSTADDYAIYYRDLHKVIDATPGNPHVP